MTWTPTSTTIEEWGQIRVTIGGKDRTYFRGVETVVQGWQDTDPYGSNNATLRLPQVTEFDQLGAGELDWLTIGKNVRIDHHLDGVLVKNLFIGFIDRIEIDENGVTADCRGDLLGWLTYKLHQPPIGRRRVVDAADAIRREIGVHDGHSIFTVNEFATGINVEMRGDRGMTRLGFVDSVLGYAIKADGSSLTILPEQGGRARSYTLSWRDLTTQHATVDAGAHGVKVRVSHDLADNPNRIYGEGVSTTGERYRNAKYPRLHNDTAPAYPMAGGASFGVGTTNADTTTGAGVTVLARELAAAGEIEPDEKFTTVYTEEMADGVAEVQERAGLDPTGVMDPTTWDRVFNVGDGPKSFAGAMFWPFAQDKRTDRFLRTADGTVIGINPDFDRSLRHVEAFENFGENVKKRQARRYAKAKLKRNSGWAGTVTLTSDPAEMSRFDLRAGMNLKVRHLKGALNQLLHISSVQVDWQNQSVTLAVSTQGRHFIDLATRKERNRVARRDPGMEFRHMLRRSAINADPSGWEGESGAGIITPTPLKGGQWNVFKVVASEAGVMSNLRLFTDDPTLFCFAVFAIRPGEAELNAHLGNPFVWIDKKNREDVWMANADWLLGKDPTKGPWGLIPIPDGRDRLMIDGWGNPDEPCGLGGKPYLDEDGNRSKWPVTGEEHDLGSWDFWTENNFLWMAVYPMADTEIRGRMRIQINDAV